MEEFLNNLNASITALENGTSPEQSQQYLQNNSAESNFPESGAIQVRDLASFVGRLADGIQRFPVGSGSLFQKFNLYFSLDSVK